MSTPSRSISLLTALALTACGGDHDREVEVPTTMPTGLALVLPAQLSPGDHLPIAWTVTDAPEGARVALRLRAPGDPVTPSSAGYLYTGSAPANGPQWWIAPDGEPVVAGPALGDLVAVLDPAASGAIEVVLPSMADGDWSVDAVVFDADGAVVALRRATVWIATGPSVRLDLSRTWAEPGDFVRAAVELRGAELEPLRLSAWLTTPDGTIMSLPDLRTGYRPVGEGQLASGRIELVGEQLGRYGEGEYLVTLALETLDGVRRGEAGAVIHVCSEPGTIAGLVATVDGAPLGDGEILALDPIDGTVVVGVVGPAGTFTIDVPAGLYRLVANGAGWDGAAVVDVGCGATSVASVQGRELDRKARRATRRATPPPIAGGSTALPAIRIGVFDGRGGLEGQSRLRDTLTMELRDAFEAKRVQAGGPVVFLGQETIQDAVRREMEAQLSGAQDDAADAASAEANESVVTQFVMGLEISAGDSSAGYLLSADLVDQVTSQIFLRVQLRVEDLGEAATAAMPRLADALYSASISQYNKPLVPFLWTLIDRPKNPALTISLDKNNAAPGEVVTATMLVGDGSPPIPVCDREATMSVRVASSSAVVTTLTARSDARGNVTLRFTVPATGAAPSYYVTGSLMRQNGDVDSATSKGFDVSPTGFGRLVTSNKGTLVTGEHAEVRIDVTGFLPFVQLEGENGQADQLDTTGGPAGHRLVDFIAGPVQGPARLIVTFFLTVPVVAAIPVPLRFYVISPLNFTAFLDPGPRLVNDGYVAIRGLVTRNGVGVPHAVVALTMNGAGLVAPGVRTNAGGAYFALYRAPHDGTGFTSILASVTVDASQIRQTVQVFYGPACASCPVETLPFTSTENMLPMTRGSSQLFSANQPVTWSVTGDGTIGTSGNLTVGQTSGTVLVRATSVTNPSNFATARVVVACTTLAEIMGDRRFTGTMNHIVTAVAPYDCSTAGRFDVFGPIDGMVQVDARAFLSCTPLSRTLWAAFPRVLIETCSIGFDSLGCGGSGVFGPDPDQPGMVHRRLTAYLSEDVAGVCTPKFAGSGILQ